MQNNIKTIIIENNIKIGNLMLEAGDIIYAPLKEAVGFELGDNGHKVSVFNNANADITDKINRPGEQGTRNPLEYYRQEFINFLKSTGNLQSVAQDYNLSMKDIIVDYDPTKGIIIKVTPDKGGIEHTHVVSEDEVAKFKKIYGRGAEEFIEKLKALTSNAKLQTPQKGNFR